MFKDYLLRRAAVVWLLVLAVAMVLAACGGAADTAEPDAADEPQAEVAEDEAVATEEIEEVAEATTTDEVEATEETVIEQEQAIAASPPASCESVDIPDNDLIPAPTADDWTKGPETASLTVIEYGDFQ